jgi:hypothetical protein
LSSVLSPSLAAHLDANRRRWRDVAQLLGASWLVRAGFIALMPSRVHSADVDRWISVARELRAGANPYVTTTYLNWPPLWMTVIWLLDHVARAVDISFLLTLQLFLIAVESVVVVLLYWFLATVAPKEARRIVLVAICLNPVAVLLVCQHGNFDVLVGLLCLAGTLALARDTRTRDVVAWLAGALALGLGALAKTVPLALAPLLAPGAKANHPLARLLAAALFVGPALLGVAVIYALAPHAVLDNVVLYRSTEGWYGLTGIAGVLGLNRATAGYSKILFPAVLLVWVTAGSVLLTRRRLDARHAILLGAIVLLAVPTLGPGYAPQYAYWWLPLLVATYPLFDRGWRRLLLGLYAIAAATYVVEYALFRGHGWFLEAFFPSSHFIEQANHHLDQQNWSTLLRLPLFAASLAVLAGGVLRLRASASASAIRSADDSDSTPRRGETGEYPQRDSNPRYRRERPAS